MRLNSERAESSGSHPGLAVGHKLPNESRCFTPEKVAKMSELEPTPADLRELAIRALWRALGRNPAQTRRVVEFPKGLTQYLNVEEMLPESQLAQAVSEIELADVALRVRTIWFVSGSHSAEVTEALDLGDDFYYVSHTLNEVEHGALQKAVPKRLAEQKFAEMSWELFDAFAFHPVFGYHPTDVCGPDLSLPESLRTFTSALNRPGFARHVVEEIYGAPWPSEQTPQEVLWEAKSTKALREFWKTAVRCEPQRHRLPPGFRFLEERSEPFEKWLAGARVYWADTAKRLDAEETNALRLTCLFLARP